MIRFSSLLWLALVAVTGFATFKVKYAVQDIEEEVERAHRPILGIGEIPSRVDTTEEGS